MKKQHQYTLKEVEELRSNMIQMDQRHSEELGKMRDELSSADETIATLRRELQAKEGH